MKMILTLSLMLASTMAFAVEVDPFDPANACTGPAMSAEKALELLGSKFSVNLAQGEKESKLQGASRFRQIINGVRGGWNASGQSHFPVTPFLMNNGGSIGLTVYFSRWNGSRYDNFKMNCDYQGGTESFLCRSGGERIPDFGTNTFEAYLSNNCFSMISRFEDAAQEREWAFALQF